jgi:hypothetical protein
VKFVKGFHLAMLFQQMLKMKIDPLPEHRAPESSTAPQMLKEHKYTK